MENRIDEIEVKLNRILDNQELILSLIGKLCPVGKGKKVTFGKPTKKELHSELFIDFE